MEELSLDNILSENQISALFSTEESTESNEKTKETQDSKEPETKETDNQEEDLTTEVNPEFLFKEQPESVGSEKETKEKEGTTSTENDTSSNFYSSFANALVEDGVLQSLSNEDISKIKTAEDFAEIITNEIKSQLDERQKRVDEALNVGLEPTDIQRYERLINGLESITEDKLNEETEDASNLRKNLIYQDCLNKGFSKEKATKMVERSIKAGTDIDDAKDALEDNKTFYKGQYNDLISKAKEESEKEKKELKKQAEALKTSILEEEKAFGEITLDKATRQRVYDSICKPAFVDPETGERLTAVQKYEMEHRTDFLKNVGLLFVLTDGFKNINKLVNDKVKKETKKSLRELEHTLKGSSGLKGNLTFANNSGDSDPESLFKGWKLSV